MALQHHKPTDEDCEAQTTYDVSPLASYHPQMVEFTSVMTRERESVSSRSSLDSGVPRFSIARLKTSIITTRSARRNTCQFRVVSLMVFLTLVGVIVSLIWLALVLSLKSRLRPMSTTSGLHAISKEWKSPADSTRLLSPWPNDFSRDIVPKACHSHNDYSRPVPLYDALAAGCTGVEADIWIADDNDSAELRVGHTHSALTADRTLSSLYIEPLTQILEHRNRSGVFDLGSNATVTLLLDFKSNGTLLWPWVQQALEPLRRNGWLRHWDSTLNRTISGPLTIVASGTALFDLINANQTYRDIFFDAPLDDITSQMYDDTNSYYASVSMSKSVGLVWFGKFSGKQMQTLTAHINAAASKGLLSRYWSTPNWPISVRDRVWDTLVKNGVGMLNVDDLISATAWNWDWCVVAGLTLCG